VSWIAGHWKGEAFDGIVEEIWSSPLAGTMMGSFRAVGKEGVNFYELCIIMEVNNTLQLQLKHFSNDLKGWEEKDEPLEFPLVKIEPNAVYFNLYTFKRISEKEMHIYVAVSGNKEEREEMLFKYFRQ